MKLIPLCFCALSTTVLSSYAALDVRVEQEEIAERGKVTRYFVQSSSAEFALNPPHGWTAQRKPSDDTLLFASERFGAVFTIRFLSTPFPKTEKELNVLLAQRWPSIISKDEASCVSRDSQGIAMDVIYPAADSTLYHTRNGFLPYGKAGVEFVLTAPEDNFLRVQSSWVSVLNSFSKAQINAASENAR